MDPHQDVFLGYVRVVGLDLVLYLKKLSKRNEYTPHKPFAEYLGKVNFSEKVRYDELDQLDKAVNFVIANFL